MKKWLALGVLGIAAIAMFAGTCVIVNIRLTEVNGKAVFAGEIQNDSGADFLQHNILVAFIGNSNQLLETKNAPTSSLCLRTLLDGGSNYFSATSISDFDDVKAGLARLAFDGVLKAGDPEIGDLTISDLVVSREGDTLTVTGTITNDDDDELFDPAVCIVVRDDDGNVVIVGKDSTLSDLDEDDADTFKVTLTVPDDADIVADVDVHVDGLEGSAGSSGVPIAPISDVGNAVTDVGDADALEFVTQPANSTGGVDFTSDVTVEVVDSDGDRVLSATTEIELAIDSGGDAAGVLTCDDTTVNAVDGLATFENCSVDLDGLDYILEATDTSLDPALSNTFDIAVGAAAKLSIAEPADTTSGAVLAPQPIVTVQDAGGNTVTTSTAEITLALTLVSGGGPGALACTTPPGDLVLDAVAGVATYAGCDITDTGTYTITASSAGLTPATTTNIVIT